MTPRLVELVREAQQLIGAHNDDAPEAVRACNVNKAWHLLDMVASRLMAEGGLVGAASPSASLEVPEGFVLIPQTALEWLYGSGPDDQGSWFGECEDCVKDGRAKYWWRRHIRKIIERGRASLLQANEVKRLSNPVDDGAVERACTCHPDDSPPRPCPQKFALTECRKAALTHPEAQGEDEARANARLIAAAPELLAALQAIVNSDIAMREEDEGYVSTELEAARAAILKATSSSSPKGGSHD